EVAKLQKILRYLLNGQLDFENIRAKGIKADNIEADKLSAISADLGEINAGSITGIEIYGTEIEGGTITGSLIQTEDSGMYPRIELSSSENLLKAESGPNSNIQFKAYHSGTPAMIFTEGGNISLIMAMGAVFSIVAGSKNLQ